MLDLFTLISFALIIASFLYNKHNSNNTDFANISSQIMTTDQSVPVQIPDDILLLIFSIENERAIISLCKGSDSVHKWEIKPDVLSSFLESHIVTFEKSSQIYLAFYHSSGVLSEAEIETMRWLTKKNFKYSVAFNEQ